MSTGMERRAEILRLARVLSVGPDELGALDGLAVAELRALRMLASDRLLARNRDQFARAVALADRLPAAWAAKLAQHAMGPVLGGRAAALLTPQKAAELARRLPPVFLASVAENVDLRSVGGLLGGISAQTMADTGAELRRREEWIVLGAFVGYVSDDRLAGLLDGFDGEALLRAGFVAEDPERLDPVVALLPDRRLDELLDAAEEHHLWSEAVALVGHLGPRQRRRVADALARSGAARLDRLGDVLAADAETRRAAVPLIGAAPPPLLAAFVGRIDDGVLGELLEDIPDDALLAAAPHVADRARVEALIALLPEGRRAALDGAGGRGSGTNGARG